MAEQAAMLARLRSQMIGMRLATGLAPSNVTRSAAAAAATNAATSAVSGAVKWAGRYTPTRVRIGRPPGRQPVARRLASPDR